MSNRFWAGEWPNLNSISITIDTVEPLTPTELGILYRLVWFVAAQTVHSQFSEPKSNPRLPIDEDRIQRIAMCSSREWSDCRKRVLPFFEMDGDGYRLIDESAIRLSKASARSNLPLDVRVSVLFRDGERCVYCGDREGPFHFDHLFPVAKGGGDNPNNIVVACARCNLSKGAKTLAEWRAGQ